MVTAVHLKDALLDAQNRNQKVHWVVHSDGAHLLHDALNMVGGRDLSCHTMIFLAPTKDVSAILPMLRKSKINLHADVMRMHDDDWRSKKTQMGSGKKLEQELAQIPGFSARGEDLRKQAQRDRHKVTTNFIKSASYGLAAGAFFLAPMVTGVAAANLAWQSYGAITNDTHQSLRNMLANRSKNPGLNPHMHPLKSQDQMNRHARQHSGSTAKTFRDVLRELVKR